MIAGKLFVPPFHYTKRTLHIWQKKHFVAKNDSVSKKRGAIGRTKKKVSFDPPGQRLLLHLEMRMSDIFKLKLSSSRPDFNKQDHLINVTETWPALKFLASATRLWHHIQQ